MDHNNLKLISKKDLQDLIEILGENCIAAKALKSVKENEIVNFYISENTKSVLVERLNSDEIPISKD